MSDELKPKISRRAFEDLLEKNHYPKRLVRILSAHFPTEVEEEIEEDVTAVLEALRNLSSKMKDVAE